MVFGSKVPKAPKAVVLRGHVGDVNTVCCINRKCVLSGSKDKRVNAWQTKTQALQTGWQAHKSFIECIAVVGDRIWTSARDKTVSIWHSTEPFTKEKDLILKVGSYIRCLAVCKDYVWGGSWENMQIWTLQGDPGPVMHGGATCACSVKANGQTFLWSGGGVVEEDLQRGCRIVVWTAESKPDVHIELQGHKEKVQCILECKDFVWSGARDNKIIVWNKKTFALVSILVGHNDAVTALALVKSCVWSTSEDRTIRSWDPVSLVPLKTAVVASDMIRSMTYVAESQEVWAGCADGSIAIMTASYLDSKDGAQVVCLFSEDNNDKYVGQAHGDKKHGQGEHHFSDGSVYVGEFVMDKRQGYGLFTSAKGDKYYGWWKNDMREGHGLAMYADGSCYIGEWSEDARFGSGEQVYPNGDRVVGDWRGHAITRGTLVQGNPGGQGSEFYPLALWQESATTVTKMFDCESDVVDRGLGLHKWAGFLQTAKSTEAVNRVDLQVLSFGDAAVATEHVERILSDRMHPMGAVLHRFNSFFQASFQPSSVHGRRSQSQMRTHAIHDLQSFSARFADHLMTTLPGAQQSFSQAQVLCIVESVAFGTDFPTLFSLYQHCYRERDSSYEAKLRALSGITLQDIGGEWKDRKFVVAGRGDTASDKSSEIEASNKVQKVAKKELSLMEMLAGGGEDEDDKSSVNGAGGTGVPPARSDASSSSEDDVDRERAARANGDIGVLWEALWRAEAYGKAIGRLSRITQRVSPMEKLKCLHQVMDAVLLYWTEQGLAIEAMGADDFMPALVYIIIKARVPNLHSEHALLNDFIRPSHFDDDGEYGLARKRLSDLEASLEFVDSVDMNVRDEEGVLLPVSLLEERVVDKLISGSRAHLDKCGEPPRWLWIAEVLLRLSNRGTHMYEPLSLDAQQADMAAEYFELAEPLFCSIGLRLERPASGGALKPVPSNTVGAPTPVVPTTVSFERQYPLYVYSKLAAAVSSFVG